MNFLLFRDNSRFFLIFSEFIFIYFELNLFKLLIISHADVADDMVQLKNGAT